MKLSPSIYTTSRLFTTGAIVGPLVDGLHNQCLLEYHRAAVNLSWLHTSLWVPPLLGFAYVVLGGVLPRLLYLITKTTPTTTPTTPDVTNLRNKAWTAVLTTALLIELSSVLETQSFFSAHTNVAILLFFCTLQWVWLDGTIAALLIASLISVLGPLSELPFVAANVWEYIQPDTFPLMWMDSSLGGLNSITGPCYFAVTMDAIALGRWYDALGDETE